MGIKRTLAVCGLTVLVASSVLGGSYVGFNFNQISDSYSILMEAHQVGKEAMKRAVTRENIHHQQNVDILKRKENVEDRLAQHKLKYRFDQGDYKKVYLEDIPTLIGLGAVVLRTGSGYLKTASYMAKDVK